MLSRHVTAIAVLAAMLDFATIGHAATAIAPAASAPEISAFDTAAPKPPRFEFARVKSAIPLGDVIGYGSSGFVLHGPSLRVRATARLDEVNTLQAGLAFKAELAAAGMESAAPEVSAFDNVGTRTEPDYRVGGVLQAVSFDECASGNDRKGSVSITVKWEVFAPKLQKVVLTRVTSGSIKTDSFESVNGRDFEIRSYRVALHALFADPELRALRPVDGPSAEPAPAHAEAATPTLHLKMSPAPIGGSQTNAPVLRQAVATILHDNMTGSGFYIADGYLLTNHHVVGNMHYVKVKLASGRVLVGEVVRDDARRDVALIKTEAVADVKPLHVSVAEAPVGEDVFAIGSPLGTELAGTFTRGVLSGVRENNGLEYLQSDVAVNPGNSGGPLLDGTSTVIGMTVSGIPRAAGLSFFIPIREAANSLQLVFD